MGGLPFFWLTLYVDNFNYAMRMKFLLTIWCTDAATTIKSVRPPLCRVIHKTLLTHRLAALYIFPTFISMTNMYKIYLKIQIFIIIISRLIRCWMAVLVTHKFGITVTGWDCHWLTSNYNRSNTSSPSLWIPPSPLNLQASELS